MYELPLFPLNTVLFPGMPVELHIFEERYKIMINQCIETHTPFGVVLIQKGRAEGGLLPEPYQIGCTAQITQVQPIGQGRMNISAFGQERFKILSFQRDKPYLVGKVESYPLVSLDESYVKSRGEKLESLVLRFLKIMDQSGQIRFKAQQQLPKDTLALAYLAAVLLHLPPAQQRAQLALLIPDAKTDNSAAGVLNFRSFITQQQSLLESQNADTFLENLCKIYHREVALLNTMLLPPDSHERSGGFSYN